MSSNEAASVNFKYPKKANICKPYFNYDNVDSKAVIQLYFSETDYPWVFTVCRTDSSECHYIFNICLLLTTHEFKLNVTLILDLSLVSTNSEWNCLSKETSPFLYNIAPRITMTRMTENLYQQYGFMFNCILNILHFVHQLLVTCVCLLGM